MHASMTLVIHTHIHTHTSTHIHTHGSNGIDSMLNDNESMYVWCLFAYLRVVCVCGAGDGLTRCRGHRRQGLIPVEVICCLEYKAAAATTTTISRSIVVQQSIIPAFYHPRTEQLLWIMSRNNHYHFRCRKVAQGWPIQAGLFTSFIVGRHHIKCNVFDVCTFEIKHTKRFVCLEQGQQGTPSNQVLHNDRITMKQWVNISDNRQRQWVNISENRRRQWVINRIFCWTTLWN